MMIVMKVRSAKSACIRSFSSCKQAEDASIGLIQICNGKTTPAPLSTTTETTTTTTSTTTAAAEPKTSAVPSTSAGNVKVDIQINNKTPRDLGLV